MSSKYGPVLSAAMALSTVVFALVSMLVCRDRASRQGFSGAFFGTLGFFLGLAAVPYTFLVTRDRTLPDRDLDQAMSGAGGSVAPGEGRLAAVCDLPREQAADYLAWEVSFKAIRLSILLVPVLATGAFWLVQFLVGGVMPTFEQLLAGMSLQLPLLPTEILISSTSGLRSSSGQALLSLVWLVLPTVGCFLMTATGYRLPVLGTVWRRTDRLWILHCMQFSPEAWRNLVPAEVFNRICLAGLTRLDLPESIPPEELPGWIRRERELLGAALWMLLPTLLPFVGLLLAGFVYVSAAIGLPLCELIGNLS